MSRTYRKTHSNTSYLQIDSIWGKPGAGKHFKRAYNKAARSAAKGHGAKDHTLARLSSEIKYKGT